MPAAKRERFYRMSERKSKANYTPSGWFGPSSGTALSPRGDVNSTGPAVSLGNQQQNQLLVKIHEKDHSDLMK